MLSLIEARSRLSLAIAQAKATLTDPEKITGKWNKDDKVYVNAMYNLKSTSEYIL